MPSFDLANQHARDTPQEDCEVTIFLPPLRSKQAFRGKGSGIATTAPSPIPHDPESPFTSGPKNLQLGNVAGHRPSQSQSPFRGAQRTLY